jgi:predicted dehydrogenase
VIGINHARVLARHPRFTVSALVDTRPNAIAAVQAVLPGSDNARAFDSLDELLGSANPPDLIVIATPSGTHVDLAAKAIAAGRHVVIEKPLDVTVARGRTLLDAANEAATRGQVISVISQRRFDPASLAVHRAIRDGRFGTVSSALAYLAWWRSQEYYDSGEWRGTWALDGGGAAMNQGVHTIDLLRWFMGRPVEIYAATGLFAHERVEIEDTATALVRFESGALATILATTAAYPGIANRIQVHGSRGSATIDNDRLDFFHAAEAGETAGDYGRQGDAAANRAELEVPIEETTRVPRPLQDGLTGHTRQYDDVAAAIDAGRAPTVDVNEALLSLALVESIYRSSRLGRAVQLDEILLGD